MSFDFDRYRIEQIEHTSYIGMLKNPKSEYIREITIATSESLIHSNGQFNDDDQHILDVRRPTVYNYYDGIRFDDNDTSPQKSWNIYANYDQKGLITRIFAWHPDIIPFWGENEATIIIPNYTNDIIVSSYPLMFKHKASARAMRNSIDSVYYYSLDYRKNSLRYIIFRILNKLIKNCRLNLYFYRKNYKICNAFEIYMLSEEVYLSYAGFE